ALVRAAAGKQATIRAKGQVGTHLRMPLQARHTAPARHLPQIDRTLIAAARQQIAAGVKAQRPYILLIAGQNSETVAALRLPDTDDSLPPCTRQPFAIRVIAKDMDTTGASIQLVQRLAGGELPHKNTKLIATGKPPAIGAKGQRNQPRHIADKFLQR